MDLQHKIRQRQIDIEESNANQENIGESPSDQQKELSTIVDIEFRIGNIQNLIMPGASLRKAYEMIQAHDHTCVWKSEDMRMI